MNKKTLITVLAALGVIGLCVGGYFLFKEVFLNDDTNNTEEEQTKNTEEDIDVNIGGEEGEWSDDISSSVPEFKEGDIQSFSTGSTSEGNTWVYIFENVDSEDFNSYKEDLETSGFENISSYTTGNDSVLMAKKDTYTVVVTYSSQEDTIGVSITEIFNQE